MVYTTAGRDLPVLREINLAIQAGQIYDYVIIEVLIAEPLKVTRQIARRLIAEPDFEVRRLFCHRNHNDILGV